MGMWGDIFGNVVGQLAGGAISSHLAPTSAQAQQQVDPMSPYRAGWAGQLAGLMNNPAAAMQLPGMQYQSQTGLDSMNRTLAAQGKNLSGQQLGAAQQYGQGMAGQSFMNYANLLNNLATPSPAASMMAGNYVSGQQSQAGGIGSSIGGGISSMIGGLFR